MSAAATASVASSELKFTSLTCSFDVSFWSELRRLKLESLKLSDAPLPITATYIPNTSSPPFLSLTSQSLSPRAPPPRRITVPGVLHLCQSLDDFKAVDKSSWLASCVSRQLYEPAADDSSPAEPACFAVLAFADLKSFQFKWLAVHPARIIKPAATITRLQPNPSSDLMSAADSALQAGCSCIMTYNPHSPITVTPLPPLSLLSSCSHFIFYDPAPLAATSAPGWPLRNLLGLLSQSIPPSSHADISVLVYRGSQSYELLLQVPAQASELASGAGAVAVGWEKNSSGKVVEQSVDLSSVLDARALATAAAQLNVRLMAWRFMPDLRPDAVSSAKVLLLGSGTLGCNIGRQLMAWGVRDLTFVDSGRVSYSNPARQSLFQFTDCLNGGRLKAEAAAERMREILPDMRTSSVRLNIPMPGHPVGDGQKQQTLADIQTLRDLIASHDVILLLTDTRESRWLPTLLACLGKKMCVSVALGFDSYAVIRHGVAADEHSEPHLGCYFCSDIVAPADSTKHRPMDQQCTVTRPSVSAISSALAVELIVAMLHEPQGASADHEAVEAGAPSWESGPLPHMIRGFGAGFSSMSMCGAAFPSCTACGSRVRQAAMDGGDNFLMSVFNDPLLLGQVSGVTKMAEDAEDVDVDWSEDEEGDGED